jgi:hypothetical protein
MKSGDLNQTGNAEGWVSEKELVDATWNDWTRKNGANMARRLLKAGHRSVVFDMSAKAVEELAQEGATASSDLRDLVKSSSRPERFG